MSEPHPANATLSPRLEQVSLAGFFDASPVASFVIHAQPVASELSAESST